MDSANLGKWLIFIGLGVIGLGIIFLLSSKLGISLGKLPGDIRYQGEKASFYFPVLTSIIISVVLTVIINLILWLFRK
jgi:hypothetical protein